MLLSESVESVYNQSGVVPYRIKNNELQVLLVTSRGGKKWVIPKGIIETNLSSQDSAKKEAFEEAGIKGTVFEKPVGRYTYKKWGGICDVEVFLFLVESLHDTWEENFRKRKWCTVKEASKMVAHPGLAHLLLTVPKAIKGKGLKSA